MHVPVSATPTDGFVYAGTAVHTCPNLSEPPMHWRIGLQGVSQEEGHVCVQVRGGSGIVPGLNRIRIRLCTATLPRKMLNV